MRPFAAKYKGACGDCETAITPGQLIIYSYGPVHDECPDEAEEPETRASVCTKCNFTVPC